MWGDYVHTEASSSEAEPALPFQNSGASLASVWDEDGSACHVPALIFSPAIRVPGADWFCKPVLKVLVYYLDLVS